jgi:hypothetical protein
VARPRREPALHLRGGRQQRRQRATGTPHQRKERRGHLDRQRTGRESKGYPDTYTRGHPHYALAAQHRPAQGVYIHCSGWCWILAVSFVVIIMSRSNRNTDCLQHAGGHDPQRWIFPLGACRSLRRRTGRRTLRRFECGRAPLEVLWKRSGSSQRV